MKYGHVPGVTKPIARLVQGAVSASSGDDAPNFALWDALFALGCNTFDTAHIYGGGESERKLGRWIRQNNLRDEVVIITKGAHPMDGRNRVTPDDITADLNDSLQRLQVEHIDLYLLHRDDPAVPVGPIVEILNQHQRAGRIGAFGGSNWTHDRIRAANEYAAAHGLTPFAMSSPNYSLAEQIKEPWAGCISIAGPAGAAARAYYHATQMPLFTWSSLAGGFFSGRFRPHNLDQFTDYFDKLCVESYCYEHNFKRLERAERLAQDKGFTLPQVALAFVMNQPLNIFALIGCRSADEFAQNIAALEMALTETELRWLDLQVYAA